MQPMQSLLKMHFAGVELMTGLPEYRNGGLFVDLGVLTSGLSDPERTHRIGGHAAEDFFAIAEEHPGRFLVAATVDRAGKPRLNAQRVRELAQHDALAMVRITPLVEQYELNHRLYYPVYATCEELGVPVSINVGIPGPQVRSRCQDPVLLEDVLTSERAERLARAVDPAGR